MFSVISFCMAIPTGSRPTSCSSSQLYRDKIRADIDLNNPQFSLVDSSMEKQINVTDLTLNITNREWSYKQFQSLGEDIFYWKLPSEFLGNKVSKWCKNLKINSSVLSVVFIRRISGVPPEICAPAWS